MNKFVISSIIFSLSTFLVGCQGDTFRYRSPELVVEGWIENGKAPIVMLTTSLPISEEYQDLSDMSRHIVNGAKVTISDGEKEFLLTGSIHPQFMPPYIYTTSELMGESEKSYRLTVDYQQFHVTAETSIPPVAQLDSFQVYPIANSDTLFQIKVFINHYLPSKSYYKIFSRISPYETYYRSFINSTFTSDILPYYNGITVFPGNISGQKNYISYFTPKDSVFVKVAQIDEASYLYWHNFEEILTTAQNPIFPSHTTIHSNIIGGKGYWCGYGAIELLIPIEDYK